jgi:ligand-binding sensor domain-containing protein
VQSLAVDNKGQLWAGTYSKGLNLFNGQGWVNYNRQNSGLSSNHVRSLSADGNNRIWIGTEWGLDVFDGKDWKNYHMHNSDLTDNEVYAVAVGGQGPSLPVDRKGAGSLTGKIVEREG